MTRRSSRAEHLTHNQRVDGASPSAATSFFGRWPSGKALRLGRSDRKFESCSPDQSAGSSAVERSSDKREDVGSNPTLRTNFTGIEFRMTNGEPPDFKGGQTVNRSILYFREIRNGHQGPWKRCCYSSSHRALLDVTYFLSCPEDEP